MRQRVLSQLPGWEAFGTETGPTIELRVESDYADELAKFRHLLADADFDALVARYPLRESRTFDLLAKALKCASSRDYEQMVVVQTAKDDALADALRKRVHPLAEAIAKVGSAES